MLVYESVDVGSLVALWVAISFLLATSFQMAIALPTNHVAVPSCLSSFRLLSSARALQKVAEFGTKLKENPLSCRWW